MGLNLLASYYHPDNLGMRQSHELILVCPQFCPQHRQQSMISDDIRWTHEHALLRINHTQRQPLNSSQMPGLGLLIRLSGIQQPHQVPHRCTLKPPGESAPYSAPHKGEPPRNLAIRSDIQKSESPEFQGSRRLVNRSDWWRWGRVEYPYRQR